MSDPTMGTVTRVLNDLQNGQSSDDAVEFLWQRYFEQIVQLVRSRLRRTQAGLLNDEEDVALSALDSFVNGAKNNRFPSLRDRNDLWRILVTIAVRKVADEIQRGGRKKRGGDQIVLDEAALEGDAEKALRGLATCVGPELDPAVAAELAETCVVRLQSLSDPMYRRVAIYKAEGWTHNEIAVDLGRSVRTVERIVQLIRVAWEWNEDASQ